MAKDKYYTNDALNEVLISYKLTLFSCVGISMY